MKEAIYIFKLLFYVGVSVAQAVFVYMGHQAWVAGADVSWWVQHPLTSAFIALMTGLTTFKANTK
jgi:hypothetical protein